MSASPRFTFQRITASLTTPTLWVFVIITGPSRNPESSTQCVPVISPLPFRLNHPAKTASRESLPRGRMAVTPVLTGPTPTFKTPSPEINVVCPTSTPFTSVIAFNCPGLPSKGTLRSRARGLFCAAIAMDQKSRADSHTMRLTLRIQVLQSCDTKTRSIRDTYDENIRTRADTTTKRPSWAEKENGKLEKGCAGRF